MNPKYPFVSSRAKHICEYCHAPEAVFNLPFEVEHIIPLSRGGTNQENNLALSCRSCNLYKSSSVSAFDKETGEIEALTAIGRVTIFNLQINSYAQLAARIQWLKLGFLGK